MQPERPDILEGPTQQIITGCGKLYVTVNVDGEGSPVEVFARLGKAGGCAGAQCEAIGRLASLALHHEVPLQEVARQIRGIECPNPVWWKGGRVLSCADGVAQALDRFMKLEGERPGRRAERAQDGGEAPEGDDHAAAEGGLRDEEGEIPEQEEVKPPDDVKGGGEEPQGEAA